MNVFIKKALLIGTGGLTGGALGYLLADYLIYKMEEKVYSFAEYVEPEVEETAPVRKKTAKQDYTKHSKSIQEKGSLSELVRPYLPVGEDRGVTKDEWVNLKETGIYVISEHVAEQHDPRYEKEEFFYYEDDGTWANSEEEIISDPMSFVGPNVHLRFGELSNDPDIVYVRNDTLSRDYELTRIHGSYNVLVLGMAEPEKPKKVSSRKKKVNNAETNES